MAVNQMRQPMGIVEHRQRVRYFALIWAGITLLVGACTFIAVYAATGIASSRGTSPVSIQPNDAQQMVFFQVTATPFPTVAAAATSTLAPTTETNAGGAVTEPTVEVPAGPTPTLSAIADTKFDLGIAVQKNADPNVYKLWVEMAASQLRLNWVKSQVVWRDTENVKGQIDFTELDVSMKLLSENNVKVLLSITKAPDWARDPGAKLQPGVYDGPPANPQDFVDFVTALLNRYPGQVHAVEVWNEINLDREWSTNPARLDPARYVELLKQTHAAIKAIDPNIIVVTAALSPTGANIPGAVMDDFDYMDALIRAGMLNYADCVGAHHNGINVPPNADYNNIPERTPRAQYRGPWSNPHHSWAFKTTLEGYHKRITAAGSNLKLCVTEFGWPSVEGLEGSPRQGFEFAFDNSLEDQANFTDQAITLMQEWGFVRLAFVWNLNYGAQVGWTMEGPVSDNVPWSILGPGFAPRPVWQRIVDRNFRGQVR